MRPKLRKGRCSVSLRLHGVQGHALVAQSVEGHVQQLTRVACLDENDNLKKFGGQKIVYLFQKKTWLKYFRRINLSRQENYELLKKYTDLHKIPSLFVKQCWKMHFSFEVPSISPVYTIFYFRYYFLKRIKGTTVHIWKWNVKKSSFHFISMNLPVLFRLLLWTLLRYERGKRRWRPSA